MTKKYSFKLGDLEMRCHVIDGVRFVEAESVAEMFSQRARGRWWMIEQIEAFTAWCRGGAK